MHQASALLFRAADSDGVVGVDVPASGPSSAAVPSLSTCPRLPASPTGKTSDIEVAREFQFAPGTVVVMDRAYVDYEWWERLSRQQVFFVTRFKSDLRYDIE